MNINIYGSTGIIGKKTLSLIDKNFQNLLRDISLNLKKFDGRVNVRPSGTEPLIRIMVESKNEKETKSASKILSNFVKKLT